MYETPQPRDHVIQTYPITSALTLLTIATQTRRHVPHQPSIGPRVQS